MAPTCELLRWLESSVRHCLWLSAGLPEDRRSEFAVWLSKVAPGTLGNLNQSGHWVREFSFSLLRAVLTNAAASLRSRRRSGSLLTSRVSWTWSPLTASRCCPLSMFTSPLKALFSVPWWVVQPWARHTRSQPLAATEVERQPLAATMEYRPLVGATALSASMPERSLFKRCMRRKAICGFDGPTAACGWQ